MRARLLVVLAGLVAVEKAALAAEIAQVLAARRRHVRIIDNIARVPVDAARAAGASVQRVAGDLLPQLDALVHQAGSDAVIIAASETLSPDDLFSALDALNDVTMISLAMIDTRTCDCFPHVRNLLEGYADHVITLPYDLAAVMRVIDAAAFA